MASIILSAWDPQEFAITDRRSRKSLADLKCGCERRMGKYSVYLAHVHAIRDAVSKARNSSPTTSREIDKVLFTGLEMPISAD